MALLGDVRKFIFPYLLCVLLSFSEKNITAMPSCIAMHAEDFQSVCVCVCVYVCVCVRARSVAQSCPTL